MKTIEEFMQACDDGICLRNTIVSKLCKKDYKKKACYSKWVKLNIKRSEKEQDLEWINVREIVFKRDNRKCQLLSKLTPETLHSFSRVAMPSLVKIIDPAHYLRRLSYPQFKYFSDNIVCLNRQSHSWIDIHCSPVTGKYISDDEIEYWWELILTKKVKDNLDKIKRQGM